MGKKKQLLIIVLSGALVYLNSLRCGFVWDDVLTVVNNDFIKGWQLLAQVFSKPLYYLTNPDYLYYRPILSLSFIFDYTLWGLRPFGFHLTNILLHLCAALLVYKFIELTLKDSFLAFCSGLLFVLHPLNTSTVAYVTSRGDILVAIFMLLSVITFLGAKTHPRYILSLIYFALALLSKESALVLPLLLIFAAEMRGRIEPAEAVKKGRLYYLGFIAAAFLYILLRVKIIGVGFNLAASGQTGLLSTFANFARALLDYIKLSFMPLGLHMLRNIPILQLKDSLFIIPLVILITIALAFLVYKLDKRVFFLAGLFLLLISPVALVSLKNPEYFTQGRLIMEEHWMYAAVPMVMALIFYLIIKVGCRIRQLPKWLLLIFALPLALLTVRENTFWQNNSALFSHTLHYVKNSPTVYRNLAWISISHQNPQNAIRLYKEALLLKQTDKMKASILRDLGYAYLMSRDANKAAETLLEGLKTDPENAGLHGLLGLLYAGDEPSKAQEEWQKALEKDPFEPMAFNGMLVESRSKSEVNIYLIAKYRKMLKLKRGFDSAKVYRSLGLLYLYSDLDMEAMLHLKRALRIDPYDIKTNNALAICYVKKGNTRMAESTFKRSLRLNPFDREVYGNLALFYKETGREKESKAMLRKSSSVNPFD